LIAYYLLYFDKHITVEEFSAVVVDFSFLSSASIFISHHFLLGAIVIVTTTHVPNDFQIVEKSWKFSFRSLLNVVLIVAVFTVTQ